MRLAKKKKKDILKILKRGEGLLQTLALVCWSLTELTKSADADAAALVNLWISALSSAAEAAGTRDTAHVMDVNGEPFVLDIS
jgi:hypothetical protein